MMTASLVLNARSWRSLRAHLFRSAVEEVAIIYAHPEEEAGQLRFHEERVEPLTSTDFSYQSAFHIELTEEAQARIIQTAWQTHCSIVELHSHVGKFAAARFSPSDLRGFNEFVPYVRWRLKGAPYGALVVTKSAFDGLAWCGSFTGPVALSQVVTPERTYASTNRTLARSTDDDTI